MKLSQVIQLAAQDLQVVAADPTAHPRLELWYGPIEPCQDCLISARLHQRLLAEIHCCLTFPYNCIPANELEAKVIQLMEHFRPTHMNPAFEVRELFKMPIRIYKSIRSIQRDYPESKSSRDDILRWINSINQKVTILQTYNL